MEHLHRLFNLLSTRVARFAAHPVVQLAVILACGIWWWIGLPEAALSSTLTIGGFILTQMVLNQQRRHDNALHLKLDELLIAMEGARNEVAGTEKQGDEEIERLRADRGDPQAG